MRSRLKLYIRTNDSGYSCYISSRTGNNLFQGPWVAGKQCIDEAGQEQGGRQREEYITDTRESPPLLSSHLSDDYGYGFRPN